MSSSRPRATRAASAALLACALLPHGLLAAQASFQNFEPARVHALRVSADGKRLYALNTPDNRLAVYSLANPSAPALIREIPVGLDPVSMAENNSDELWVVNSLSDSIDVVSLSAGRVIDVIRVKDEPADIAFAGSPKRAFVSAAASDELRVFDASTHAQLGSVAIFAKDPSALAVRADGARVYVAAKRSGNKSTLIPSNVAPQPAPIPGLPPIPKQALIIDSSLPQWQSQINWNLPDYDVFEINAANLNIERRYTGIGTTLFDIAVHPGTGNVYVANTNARNTVAFEPVLAAHAISNRVTRFTPGSNPATAVYDLDAGINFATLPNPAAKSIALAEPVALAIDALANAVWVAAQGTDRIARLSTSGAIQARIEIGDTPGSAVHTASKRGPRALALLASANRLYVLNALSASISVVDTLANSVLLEFPLAYDPTPANIKTGRKFLYDAKLSGNGTMSCAACHVDGDVDGLAWNLGDPNGALDPEPTTQPFPFNQGLTGSFHPMKGPMSTQTLRGLSGVGPFHWRGDRPDLFAFQKGFTGIMGSQQLAPGDMDLYVQFMSTVLFPPNPLMKLDRTHNTTPFGANANAGMGFFNNTLVSLSSVLGINGSCATCHAGPNGTSGFIVSKLQTNSSQDMKVPQLRNLYRKKGFASSGQVKSGFGFSHSGEFTSTTAFLNQMQFSPWPTNQKDDITAFLDEFDTGTAPTVGYQVRLDTVTVGQSSVQSDIATLIAQAELGNCDLVAKGLVNNQLRGLVYDKQLNVFRLDDPAAGAYSASQLNTLAQSGAARIVLTGVPVGSGTRIGVDRDLDGLYDGIDGATSYGIGTAGCAGVPPLFANSEAKLGNAGFALGATSPAAQGFLAWSGQSGSLAFLGTTVLVGPSSPAFFATSWGKDASGFWLWQLPIPAQPGLTGAQLFVQGFFVDACAPQGLAATSGLQLTIQP